MREAFSANRPRLRLNRMQTTTDQNEQRGYMELFAGAMTAIRNPRAHEDRLHDDPETALELLTLRWTRKIGQVAKRESCS